MQIKRNYVLGLPPPSKIPNSELLDDQRKLLPNITEGHNYSLVSHKIWKILQLIYEGGINYPLKERPHYHPEGWRDWPKEVPNRLRGPGHDQGDQGDIRAMQAL
jgi:hypothetical protein